MAMAQLETAQVLPDIYNVNVCTAFDPNTEKYIDAVPVTLYNNSAFSEIRRQVNFSAEDLRLEFADATRPGVISKLGKSPSVFVFSQTGRFILKELKKSEVPLFLGVIPQYLQHLSANTDSLLIKYLYLLKINDRFLVLMKNIFTPPETPCRRIPQSALAPRYEFDLKGSSVGRSRSPGGRTLKDNDLHRVFCFDQKTRQKIYGAVVSDSDFLKTCGFIDYSLVVGVTDSLRRFQMSDRPIKDTARFSQSTASLDQSDSVKIKREIKEMQKIKEQLEAEKLPGFVTTNDEIFYCQIVDFFTDFTPRKKLERILKGVIHDGDKVSVQNPEVYCERFQKFIATALRVDEGL